MKKSYKVLCCSLALATLLGTNIPMAHATGENNFPDLEGHWSKDYVEKCLNNKDGIMIFQGDEQGNFNPNGTVSLGQFLTVVTRLAAPDKIEPVGGHWANQYYQAAVTGGIIHSSDFSSENLDAPLSRADMAYILVNAAKVKGETLTSISGVESLIGDWSSVTMGRQDAVKKAYSNGLITGKDGGLFAPNDTMTRGEMATVIARLQNYTNRAQVDTSKITPPQNPYSNPFKNPSSSSQNREDIYKPASTLQTFTEGEAHTIPQAGDIVITKDGRTVVLTSITIGNDSYTREIVGFGQGVDIVTGVTINGVTCGENGKLGTGYYNNDRTPFVKSKLTNEVYTMSQWKALRTNTYPEGQVGKEGDVVNVYWEWDSTYNDWHWIGE